ncbi:response regulator transcription factor [Alicyclobacillus kakegawensis]|uniref:response regulator transcription factor n=1 Tax=Alicyclobacillus kakegawensis TaxID=392012 RepID=UPI0008317B37|nr:response regulator transcription factor [Alicyclobacillus kakegawensis]
MRVLIVEDEVTLANAVREALSGQQMVVDWATGVEDGFDKAFSGAYDCIVVDVMLPDGSGVDLVSDLREAGCGTPILMLTVLNETADRVRGLNAGADDYLGKPFHLEELIARIHALVRRSVRDHKVDCLQWGPAILWRASRTLEVNHKSVELSSKEFLLMEYLLRHPGRVLTRDQLVMHLWGPDAEVADSALDTYVYFLRKKCARLGLKNFIRTVRGQGYRIEAIQ